MWGLCLLLNPCDQTYWIPLQFRMISGDMMLRSYNSTDPAQQAVSFLCLDFQGTTPPPFSGLPNRKCPSGIRSQLNFPSCWDGKNVDSTDHKSHVAFLSEGPDKGTCSNPSFPKTLPRLFSEVRLSSLTWADGLIGFVFPCRSTGLLKRLIMFVIKRWIPDNLSPLLWATLLGMATTEVGAFSSCNDSLIHQFLFTDFFNGWQNGVLQKAVDNCHCNAFGDVRRLLFLRYFPYTFFTQSAYLLRQSRHLHYQQRH